MKDLSMPVPVTPAFLPQPPRRDSAPMLDLTRAARMPDPVQPERAWRYPPQAAPSDLDTILVSRWTCEGGDTQTVSHPGDARWHCISLNLRTASVRLLCGGKPIFDGRLAPGAVQITAPGVAASATYDGACDVLHLFVPQSVLARCHSDQFGHAPLDDVILDDPFLHTDPALERLGQALAVAQTQDPGLGRMFADSVALAIVSRVVAAHFHRAATGQRTRAKLPQWRLRRALEYIDANLDTPIGLADIAESTGMTRMHFAAQFRRTTGMRPHEYLLRRRIEHAQDLLRQTGGSVLDVALRCGFRSQAHFTTVFKRFVGDTPHCWRVKVATTTGSSHA